LQLQLSKQYSVAPVACKWEAQHGRRERLLGQLVELLHGHIVGVRQRALDEGVRVHVATQAIKAALQVIDQDT
jgi:hypothetical protein